MHHNTEDPLETEISVTRAASKDSADLPIDSEDPYQIKGRAQLEANKKNDETKCQEQENLRNSGRSKARGEIVLHNGTDRPSMEAIQKSYATFELKPHLQFCCGFGSFDRSPIELSTNWKYQSILNQVSWNSLKGILQQILSYLPAPAKRQQLQGEKGLVQRILQQNIHQKSEKRSLKPIVSELHRERNYAKDETILLISNFIPLSVS